MSFKKMNIRRLMEFSRTNGRIENRSATPSRYQINQANGVLDHIGVVEQPKENFTTNKCAEIYLYGINCAITSERIDFSLLQNQTDRDYKFLALGLMQNMALKNQQILLYDKFIDPCDPIYNLDDNRPFNIQEEAERNKGASRSSKSNPDFISTASNTAHLNTKRKGTLIEYWSLHRDYIMRGKF